MYLPAPTAVQKHMPSATIYHMYPMDYSLVASENYKDERDGRVKERKVRKSAVAYANLVIPTRDAVAYSKFEGVTDFGTPLLVDKEKSNIYLHNSYGVSDLGGRNVTNVIIYHKEIFDGNNASEARMVIGDENILISAMYYILPTLTDVPYLQQHVRDFVYKARGMVTGIIFHGSVEWASPMWAIVRDKLYWDKIITDFYKR